MALKHRLSFVFYFIFAFTSLSGCAYVQPYIQDFNIVSVPQEIQLGNQFGAQIAEEMKIVQNTRDASSIAAMGQKLVSALPRQDFQYEFFVVEDASPNAFTIPGGKIYVHTGLIDFVDNESQLAGVIGHELGHAFERHPVKSLSRAYGVEALTKLLFKNTENAGQIQSIALNLTKGGILSRYGREDELEADELGLNIAIRAGYDAEGLLQFLSKLQSLEKPGGQGPAFLQSHPPTAERVEKLQQMSSPGNITRTANTQRYFNS